MAERQEAAPEAPPPADGEPEFDFESAFERLAGAPCRVERILLVGLERTKDSVVHPALMRVKGAGTLEEIRDAALEAWEELVGLDIFDAVDVVLGEGSKVGAGCVCRQRGSHVLGGSCPLWHLDGTAGNAGANMDAPSPRTLVAVGATAVLIPTLLPSPTRRALQGSDTCTVIARFQEKNMVRLHAGTYVQGTEGGREASDGRVYVWGGGVGVAAAVPGAAGAAPHRRLGLHVVQGGMPPLSNYLPPVLPPSRLCFGGRLSTCPPPSLAPAPTYLPASCPPHSCSILQALLRCP